MNLKSIAIASIAVGLGLGIAYVLQPPAARGVQVKIPASFSTLAAEGKGYFEKNCMECHGKNGTGSENGPPLVHKIYEPGHHSDRSFYRAVAQGVQAHHWSFGNMPELPDVKENEVTAIIKYVREIQQENGIF